MTFDEAFTFEHLYKSYLIARKGKRNKNSTAKYEVNAIEFTNYLLYQFKNNKYKIGKYKEFYVYEPKKRLIMSLPFKDRAVQHCLCDYYLEPLLEKSMIYDNYANRKNKGTHKALNRLENYFHKFYRKHKSDGYVLKCDISKYFYSVNHDVLKNMISRYIKDRKILNFTFQIIDSTENPGLPIGNQTSQWFAIFYMSCLDHFIKEKLHIKYYERYMDDFLLIHNDKEYLKYCKSEISNYVENELKLKLNNKTQIFPLKNGVDFLGFHTYLTETGKVIRKVRRNSKKGMNNKLKKFKKLCIKRKISKEQIDKSYNSWIGHVSHGNSYHLIKNMDKKYKEIFKDGD
jgi:hypothetical protein